MNQSAYVVIHKNVIPEVFLKVLEVKELLRIEPGRSVADAVKAVGISRSTFYKYADSVFSITDAFLSKKAVFSMILDHHSGLLSEILTLIAEQGGNILTISQNTPIHGKANVSITLDITGMSTTFTALTSAIQDIPGVHKFTIDAIEAMEDA